jgi:hypothetical protein
MAAPTPAAKAPVLILCKNCNLLPAFKMCSSCHAAAYCSNECQTVDWRTRHATECSWHLASVIQQHVNLRVNLDVRKAGSYTDPLLDWLRHLGRRATTRAPYSVLKKRIIVLRLSAGRAPSVETVNKHLSDRVTSALQKLFMNVFPELTLDLLRASGMAAAMGDTHANDPTAFTLVASLEEADMLVQIQDPSVKQQWNAPDAIRLLVSVQFGLCHAQERCCMVDIDKQATAAATADTKTAERTLEKQRIVDEAMKLPMDATQAKVLLGILESNDVSDQAMAKLAQAVEMIRSSATPTS